MAERHVYKQSQMRTTNTELDRLSKQGGYGARSTVLGKDLLNVLQPVNASNWLLPATG